MSKTSMFCFVYVCRRMLNPSMIICVCDVVSNRRCHRHLGRLFWATASTAGGNETCVAVAKYRWQIDRLKILQALLGIFCAKIPFFSCCSVHYLSVLHTLDVIQFLHSTFVYSLNIYVSVLVLFLFCVFLIW